MDYDSIDFCTIHYKAQSISDSANVAYWLASGARQDGALGLHIETVCAAADDLAKLVADLRANHPYFAKPKTEAA